MTGAIFGCRDETTDRLETDFKDLGSAAGGIPVLIVSIQTMSVRTETIGGP